VATVASALVLALAAAACGASATPSPSAAASGGTSLDGTWILTSYTGLDGTQANVPAVVKPSLTFSGNAVTGTAGCNTYSAVASIGTDPNTIHYANLASTKKACPPPAGTIETVFLQALNLASTWQVTGDQLVIQAPGGKPSLTFHMQSS